MSQNIDLTTGSISQKLIKFTLPILGSSFIGMTYTFVDMICIGALGSGSVAAVGSAGFFMWFANASSAMARIGTQVLTSQAYGRKNYDDVKKYSEAAIWINLLFGLLVAILLTAFNKELIEYFNLGDAKIILEGRQYLVIIALAMPFTYVNPVISAMLNSVGDSKSPFVANAAGLVFNIVFDVLLVFGLGPFPALGVIGAGVATSLAAVLTFVILLYRLTKLPEYIKLKLFKIPARENLFAIMRTGFPSALQSTLYCCYSIVLARIISQFGATSIAVQKVGGQIESISWMTADGLAIAATAFVGQNYGVKNFERIRDGIRILSRFTLLFGLFATVLLIFYGGPLYSIFLREPESILGGASYARILGFSQIFMCLELLYIGIFNGHGETRIPALMSILLTGSRIPIALILSKTSLGVDGIWWAISGTSIVKGTTIPLVFYLYQHRLKKNHVVE